MAQHKVYQNKLEENCRTCKGSGKQTFHGAADSYRATCNFCGGHGTRAEELKWYDHDFKERGLTRKYLKERE